MSPATPERIRSLQRKLYCKSMGIEAADEITPIRGTRLCCGLVDLQQCGEVFADFIKQFGRSDASHFDVSLLPGDTAHLVHQNDASNSVPGWNGNFKRITSGATGNWTNDTKTRWCIALPRCQHNRWTMTALLLADRGI